MMDIDKAALDRWITREPPEPAGLEAAEDLEKALYAAVEVMDGTADIADAAGLDAVANEVERLYMALNTVLSTVRKHLRKIESG